MDALVPGMSDVGPSQSDRLRSGIAVLVSLVILTGLLATAFVGISGVLGRVLRPGAATSADFAGPGSDEVVVEVRRGETPRDIGKRLAGASVVASPGAFVNAALADAQGSGSLQPGFYRLRKQMSGTQAFALMLDPAARAENRVTLPEGLRLEETLNVLARGTGLPVQDYVTAARTEAIGLPRYARKPEGFLFPATYDIPPNPSATAVLKMTTARFARAAKQARLEEPSKYGPYDVVTVASLIEGEARRPEDYAKVARVIYNRLRAGQPLGLDSTVNYAMKTSKQAPSKQDIAVDSPYNTYRRTGLPPGPISSPGEQALDAAKHPARGPWLYFVTTDPESGLTKFTESYEEFLAFKREYQRKAGVRTG